MVSALLSMTLFLNIGLEINKKPRELSSTGLLVVERATRESRRGGLTKESLVRFAHYGLFPLTGFANKFAALNEKSPAHFAQGFLQ
jgi:hypothetical protein